MVRRPALSWVGQSRLVIGIQKGPTWARKGTYGDVPVYYIGKEQFIANKRAIGRTKDLADVEALGEQ